MQLNSTKMLCTRLECLSILSRHRPQRIGQMMLQDVSLQAPGLRTVHTGMSIAYIGSVLRSSSSSSSSSSLSSRK